MRRSGFGSEEWFGREDLEDSGVVSGRNEAAVLVEAMEERGRRRWIELVSFDVDEDL